MELRGESHPTPPHFTPLHPTTPHYSPHPNPQPTPHSTPAKLTSPHFCGRLCISLHGSGSFILIPGLIVAHLSQDLTGEIVTAGAAAGPGGQRSASARHTGCCRFCCWLGKPRGNHPPHCASSPFLVYICMYVICVLHSISYCKFGLKVGLASTQLASSRDVLEPE